MIGEINGDHAHINGLKKNSRNVGFRVLIIKRWFCIDPYVVAYLEALLYGCAICSFLPRDCILSRHTNPSLYRQMTNDTCS